MLILQFEDENEYHPFVYLYKKDENLLRHFPTMHYHGKSSENEYPNEHWDHEMYIMDGFTNVDYSTVSMKLHEVNHITDDRKARNSFRVLEHEINQWKNIPEPIETYTKDNVNAIKFSKSGSAKNEDLWYINISTEKNVPSDDVDDDDDDDYDDGESVYIRRV